MLIQYYLINHSLRMNCGKVMAKVAEGAVLADQYVRQLGVDRAFVLDEIKYGTSKEETKKKLRSKFDNMMDYIVLYKKWRGEYFPVDESKTMTKIMIKAKPQHLERGIKEYDFARKVVDSDSKELAVVVLPVLKEEKIPSWLMNMDTFNYDFF